MKNLLAKLKGLVLKAKVLLMGRKLEVLCGLAGGVATGLLCPVRLAVLAGVAVGVASAVVVKRLMDK